MTLRRSRPNSQNQETNLVTAVSSINSQWKLVFGSSLNVYRRRVFADTTELLWCGQNRIFGHSEIDCYIYLSKENSSETQIGTDTETGDHWADAESRSLRRRIVESATVDLDALEVLALALLVLSETGWGTTGGADKEWRDTSASARLPLGKVCEALFRPHLWAANLENYILWQLIRLILFPMWIVNQDNSQSQKPRSSLSVNLCKKVKVHVTNVDYHSKDLSISNTTLKFATTTLQKGESS